MLLLDFSKIYDSTEKRLLSLESNLST